MERIRGKPTEKCRQQRIQAIEGKWVCAPTSVRIKNLWIATETRNSESVASGGTPFSTMAYCWMDLRAWNPGPMDGSTCIASYLLQAALAWSKNMRAAGRVPVVLPSTAVLCALFIFLF